MRIFKKMIIFIVFFLIINLIISEIVTPYDSQIKKMWNKIEKTQFIDIAYTGSSVARSFDEKILSEEMNEKIFNFWTPGQSLEESYILIEYLYKKYKIKHVVLSIGYFSFLDNNYVPAKMLFIKERNKTYDFKKMVKLDVKYILQNISKTESINYLIPWIYNHIKIHPQKIIENFNRKNGKIDKKSEYSKVLDFNTEPEKNTKILYHIDKKIRFNYSVLETIIVYCIKNNIELIIINTPHPTYDIISFGPEYYIIKNKIENISKKYNVEYYDFNMVKSEIFKSKEIYFMDFEHLNDTGTSEFTKSFVKFLKIREKEKDMSKYFYNKDEYLESIKNISAVNLDIKQNKDIVELIAEPYTGTKVDVEYEFLVYDKEKNNYKIIQQYSKDEKCLYKIDSNENYKFRVNVRQKGTNIGYEKYCEKNINNR